ncbi:hypothetical protein CIG75_10485 [Tumebacillus algifaecis]|uniref:Carrier domain-containing protein n=1 Tax=Tumebacillus algifaecis TaxID=1214604 RepID=A0A223D217_9BACL|nr:non-ribosomal peptide synthetase [Tumebacillus algifaecis]ASS75376.1 hypothetical protein CIG75_10485 [Tumebacillus algifaecis]
MEQSVQQLPLVQVLADLPRTNEVKTVESTLSLSQELQAELRVFAKQAGVGDTRILLTAYQTLLYRYTAEQEIAVLARVSEDRGIALWSSLSDTMSFQELLQAGQVQEVSLATVSAHPLILDLSADTVRWSYNGALYSQELIMRLSQHFLLLLGGAVQEPERMLGQLPLLTERERRELAAKEDELSGGDAPLLHLQVDAQAERWPNKVALEFQGATLTYGELQERSNRLAMYLCAQGVGPEVLVGLYMERSLDVVVAILAIFKAGGAYVPLDPKLPQDRIQFMLEDAAVNVLVTYQHLLDQLPETECRAVLLDAEAGAITQQPDMRPELGAAGHNLAYLIYTSGSTGKPKAVMVEHRHVMSTLEATVHHFSFTEDDVMPLIASVAFDISFLEMFVALVSGGKTVIIAHEQVLDFPRLIETIKGFTALHAVPSLMRQIVQSIGELGGTAEEYGQMRLLLVGGDAVAPDLLAEMHSAFPNAEVHVMYGPTEGAIICSTHHAKRQEKIEGYPIGKRLGNAWMRVYDGHGNLMPLGVPGELYLGGHGVTRGYRGREDLTAEKYVELDGTRWYRTGDLVRRLADGTFDFLGRIDNQVKIRGFRIEIGEIETRLATHVAINETVVTARADGDGEKRLVAYLVLESEVSAPTVSELREHLQVALPDYMVPSAFVYLSEFPLNPNGKIDRKRLPEPEWTSEEGYAAPRTQVEELVCGAFADVLGVRQVGIRDSFFERGGNSLLATQVISRVRRALNVELPMQSLLEAQSAEELARELERILASGEAARGTAISPVPRMGREPLSFAQQRMWFFDQLEGSSALYNVPYALRLTGPLDRAAFTRSIETILGRHEALRTTYVDESGQPHQVIAPFSHGGAAVTFHPQMDEEIALQWLQREADRPFDLENGPVLRVEVVPVLEHEHLLLLNLHHIASDGWSMGVLLRELAELYQGNSLPELRVQYADYAAWQRDWLQGEVLEEQLAYWSDKLQGAPALLELPLDHPRKAVQTYRGAVEFLTLSNELKAKLDKVARQENVTLYMLLLAAFKVLLHRYTDQTDQLVGSPIAGRHYGGVEELIGFFVNTLVMRTDLSGDPAFDDLLAQVRTTTLEAYAHQDLPFDNLVEALQPERNLSYSPLIQTFFALQNMPMPDFSVSGLAATPLDLTSSTAKFDLAVVVEERAGGLLARFEYASDLFEATTIMRMAGHFQTLLEGIATASNSPISQLPLLTGMEQPVLHGTMQEPTRAVYQIVEEQAARTPEAVALRMAEAQMTYRELNAQANSLARHLRELGAGADTLVGVLMERSMEVAVALLAVHKAGAAYVPLDPKHPQERIEYMLDDTKAPIVITQARLAGLLTETGAQVVQIDEQWTEIANQPVHNLDLEFSLNQLAYLLYTSGSTGRPKAVMVEQQNLISSLWASVEEFGFRAGDVMPWTASVAFDIAQFELFCPLMTGGTTVILPEDLLLDFPRWAEEVQSYTAMFAVPSLMRQLVQSMREEGRAPADYANMRLLFCGGDAVYADLLEMQHEMFPQADVYVLYGPTEGTILCTHYLARRGNLSERCLLGTNLKNANLRVCDRHGNLVPFGVPGELIVEGAGVARGYRGQEELTAEKFGSGEAGRFYRTGDSVRLLENGLLEFLGRMDSQVKIRGFRIEVGEIEAVLGRHAAVREAVVTVREDVPGDKRLAAYVVKQDEVTASVLRDHLSASLPEYMVPSAFVFLEKFPLNPNGKIDRNRLPKPEEDVLDRASGGGARSQEEELVGGVFAQVLELPAVGREDHFFTLGGHSLLATQAVARLRKLFGVDLSVKALFQAPTVASLTEEIMHLGRGVELPPIHMAERNGLFPVSNNQRRLWFIEQVQAGDGLYHIPLTIRMRGELNRAALTESMQKLVARHEALRTVFIEVDGAPMQRVIADLTLMVQVHSGQEEATVWQTILAEAKKPFDLARGPLIRADLFELKPHDHLLLLNLHHIIADGWSVEVFMKELGEVYAGITQEREPQLPEMTLQFADYAKWEQEVLHGERMEQTMSYWKRQLSGTLPVLDLPTDHPRQATQTYVGTTLTRELPSERLDNLAQIARREGVSMYMLLLAAFNVLLYRWTGQSDLVVGSPSAGRERAEVENVFGFFVNTLVLRSDLSGSPSFLTVLQRVRDVTLDALAHQAAPLERLMELQPQSDRRYSPLFQTMFVLQDVGFDSLQLPGLSWEMVESDLGIAKFDLTLYVEERADGMKAMVEYNTDLFNRVTMERLLQQWQTLLESISEDPDRSIGELPLNNEEDQALTEEELDELFI